MKRLKEFWKIAIHHLTLPGLILIFLGMGFMAGGLGYHLHWLGMAAPVPGFEELFARYIRVADSIMSVGFLLFVLGAVIAIVRLLKVTLASPTDQ